MEPRSTAGDEWISTDTNLKLEESRLRARHDAAYHSSFPTSVTLNGVSIPLAKWAELESLKVQSLRQRAVTLKETVMATGSRFFEHYEHLAYRPGSHDVLAHWMINVQVALVQALGYELDAQSFGAPPTENMWDVDVAPPTNPSQQAPCWSQHDLENQNQVNAPGSRGMPNKAYQQQRQPPPQQRQYQHAERYEYPQRPSTAESRSHEAAQIKARGEGMATRPW